MEQETDDNELEYYTSDRMLETKEEIEILSFVTSYWNNQTNSKELAETTTTTYANTTIASVQKNDDYVFNLVYISLCTFFVAFGCLSNLVSFFVFLKASRRKPRIVMKNLLIMFTVSNTSYLVLFWYNGKYLFIF